MNHSNDHSLNMQQLSREDGTKMHAYVIPDFLQALGYSPTAVWDTLNDVPTLRDDADTFWGETPVWTPGTHPALNYRGNAIKRTKSSGLQILLQVSLSTSTLVGNM